MLSGVAGGIPNFSVHYMMTSSEKVVENSIVDKLNTNLHPTHIDVINESYMHNVPKGSETHFKVVVVSKEFEDKPLIQVYIFCNLK